ncbi:MAG: tRNA glutamyl-Q(34) synthetase GluQRS [Planctomycetota bacterium]
MAVTRLAPSPTGALHLGNARTFLVNWALARRNGWRVLLRIEDLDGPRIKAGAAAAAIETLAWLGLDWDGPPVYQSADAAPYTAPYTAALKRLAAAGQIYPCRCTRSQVVAASLSAPHAGDPHEVRYTGACRPPQPAPLPFTAEPGTAWRLRVPGGEQVFTDRFAGEASIDVQQAVGDFLVATKAGLPSYQLAVVVDDCRQGVTHVVRGDDLLASTPRQLLLMERLGFGPPPEYFHVPLVIGPDGRRLAKRHGDSRIQAYHGRGVPAERIIGLLAEWCGVGPRREQTAEAFCQAFSLDAMPRGPVTFTAEDDRWLLGG